MRAIKQTSQIILGVSLALGVLAGCVKKRPDQFAQTEGINAEKVQNVMSWEHTLKTKDAVFTPNKSVAEEPVYISEDLSDIINNYPLVSYETDSELLGEDIPLRGKPNHTYQIRYELGDSLLRILKVDKKENIPSEEWPYAVKLEDGRLGVPLVGYKVSYFDVVNRENDDREKTSTLIEKPVKDPKLASYVRIDRASRSVFEAVQKVDTYPADYFQGEWFYQATVVQTPTDDASAITAVGAIDTQLVGAEKVKIRLDNRRTLLGVNVNQDERIKDNALDEGYVFSIPIEWKEFEAVKTGRGYGLKEQEVERREETSRPYVKIKFEEHFAPGDLMSSSILGLLLEKASSDQKLVDVKLAKDYFSFTLLKANQGLKIRYAFRRNINSGYKDVRPYDERDFETFGYFHSTPNIVLTRDFQRKEDVQRLSKMNRFNPNVREIVYHFSKESPKEDDPRSGWVREIGRYAVHFWDQAFQKAGVNVRIRLDESKDVDLGDLRYNVLHIIDPLTYSSLGGYGPSVADPETGEIVSATSNILVSPYTEGMASNIRSYIYNQIGSDLLKVKNFNKGSDIADAELSRPLKGLSQLQVSPDGSLKPISLPSYRNGKVHQVEATLSEAQEHLLKIFSMKRNLPSVDKLTEAQKATRYHDMMHDSIFGSKAAFLSSATARHKAATFTNGVSSHIAKRIQAECPAVDEFIAQTKRASGEYATEQEVAVVEACTRKLARLPLLNVFLHEMGHNFSLAHNFKCSADPGPNKSNFWTADEIRREFTGLNGEPFPEEFLPQNINPKASCVMDYMPDDYGVLPVPGKYDIAAIRFIYGGKVETKDGEIKPLYSVNNGKKVWKTINQTFGNSKGVLKPLAYCSDIDAYLGSDPLCRQHDIGESPEEIVDYAINEFWNSLRNSTYSYDRLRAGNFALAGLNRQLRYMLHLKRIYDEWRFHLSRFLGPNKGYLETMDTKAYEAVLEKMKNSPVYGDEFARYKPARDKIVNFLIQVAFMPNRYCLGTTPSNALKAIELSKAIEQVGFFGHEGAIRCQDKEVMDVLRANGIELLAEFGFSLNNIHFSNAPRALQEAPDVWGTATDRVGALSFLGIRMNNSLVHSANGGLYPAIMDEPNVRERVLTLYRDRLLKGVNLTSSIRTIKGYEQVKPEEATLRMFRDEQGLLNAMSSMIPQSLIIPGKVTESSQALALFGVQRTNNPQQAQAVQQQGAIVYQSANGVYMYAAPQNAISYAVIQRLLAVPSEITLQSSGVNEAAIAQVTQEVLQKFPEDASQLSMYDLFQIIDAGGKYVQSNRVDVSVRAVFSQLLVPYIQLLSNASGGQFEQVRRQYYQTVAQIAELEKNVESAGTDPTPPTASSEGATSTDQASQLTQLKQTEAQLKQQLKTIPVAKTLANYGMPSTKAEFEAAVQEAMKEVVRLQEMDPMELKAHQDVLNSAIMTW